MQRFRKLLAAWRQWRQPAPFRIDYQGPWDDPGLAEILDELALAARDADRVVPRTEPARRPPVVTAKGAERASGPALPAASMAAATGR